MGAACSSVLSTLQRYRRVFSVNVNGIEPPIPLSTGSTDSELLRSVSGDDRWLAVSRSTPKTGRDLWIQPLGAETPAHLPPPIAAFSPDGHWIAYSSNQRFRTGRG
jgi:Tol biopolymer transport system component